MCLIHFWVIPFFSFSPLWGNKKWAPQYKDEEIGKFLEQNQLNRLQVVQFECPKYINPLVSSLFVVSCGDLPFPAGPGLRGSSQHVCYLIWLTPGMRIHMHTAAGHPPDGRGDEEEEEEEEGDD